MKVLAFGEVLWDMYETEKFIGGAPLNFSAHFKKCGGDPWMVTAVGNDALGRETVETVEKLGINTEFINTSDKETGKCVVTLNDNGIPSYDLLNNVAYDFTEKPDLKGEKYDILYFGTLALRGENNKQIIKQIMADDVFDNIFVDLNIRTPYYSSEVVDLACKSASIIKISDEELPIVMELTGNKNLSVSDNALKLSADYKNLKLILITCGEKGSVAFSCEEKKFYECSAKKVEFVSTVGAGDSFSAAFMASYLQSGDIQKSLEFASKISAYVVSCKDAVPEYELNMFD